MALGLSGCGEKTGSNNFDSGISDMVEDNNVSDDLSKSGKIKDCVSYSYAITNSENPVKVYVADKDNEIDRVRIVLPDAEDLVNVHTNMYNNYTLNLKNYNSIVWEEDGSLKGFKVAI
jgi:hypothetical protein